MEAYCVKCRTKREMIHAEAGFNASGAPITRGSCMVCGTTMVRIGATEAHEGLDKPEKKPASKSKSAAPAQSNGRLVIVESPAKARAVGRFLGKGFTVRASVGHVRDLPKFGLSVDVEHDFEPKYVVPKDSQKVVKELRDLAARASEVYLATDPDREGEAIAWHVQESARIDPDTAKRVVFHEITKPAIVDAFAHPRKIDMDLVEAQQARRIVDRLVGYKISPLLWRKVKRGLSAGRVQSVALRMVVEREREIQGFNPVEYWSIDAELAPQGTRDAYIARLAKVNGEDPALGKEDDVLPLVQELEEARYQIKSIRRYEKKRHAQAPFTTSTLQQEASRRMRFSPSRTMVIAQQLYEGVNVGEGGETGLITYMRTDSTNVSSLALDEARSWIRERYGSDFLPEKSNIYRTKAASAQEAHEAIRPTSVRRTPDAMRAHLNDDQFRLYQLIWNRFVASQMESAVYDAVTVEVDARGKANLFLLRASGSHLKFKGFLEVYEESRDEDRKSDDEEINRRLPKSIQDGQTQDLLRLIPEQHFTQPPPRYTEASLVQALDEEGIGRPSTYASIMETILNRHYVTREKRRLVPTEMGFTVNDLLVDHFTSIVDRKFTAKLESELDDIAAGEAGWVDVLKKFYGPFEAQVEQANVAMPEVKSEPEKVGRTCPECGSELVYREGRFGRFIACSGFPKCRYKETILQKIGVSCPLDGGDLIRRSSRGRVFYGCSNYPDCKFVSSREPIGIPCPNCGGMLVKSGRGKGQCTKCSHVIDLEDEE